VSLELAVDQGTQLASGIESWVSPQMGGGKHAAADIDHFLRDPETSWTLEEKD